MLKVKRPEQYIYKILSQTMKIGRTLGNAIGLKIIVKTSRIT